MGGGVFLYKRTGYSGSPAVYPVDGRFRSRTMILTANRAISDWPGLYPHPIIANAIVVRIAHTSHQIVIKRQSYGKKLKVKTDEKPS